MRTATRLTRLLLSTLLLLAIVPVSAPAWSSTGDSTWTWVNPAPTGATLNQLYFVDANTGWVVGGWGAILKTTDAGATWTSQDSGVFNNIRDVDFIDANTGWAVTDYNINAEPAVVLRTSNGGTTWTPADPNGPADLSLNGVDFASATKGWAVGRGGAIQATIDGGVNWNPQTSGVTSWLTDVKFSSETTGIAVGYQGAMLKTSDGGTNWSSYDAVNAPWTSSANLYEIRAFDDDNWQVATSQGTYVSSDGGATWQGLLYGGGAAGGMYFADADHGWVVSYSNVRRTSDGATTWQSTNTGLPSEASLTDVWFTSTTHGIAIGRYGALLTSDDGGVTWNTAWGTPMENSIGTSAKDVNDLEFLGGGTALACSYDGIVWRSTNGGLTWTQDILTDEPDVQEMDFATSSLGYAVGDYGYGGAGVAVLKTTDAGLTWMPQTTPLGGDHYLYGVSAFDANNVWAVGQIDSAGGFVAHTSDGSNWTTQTVDPSEIPDLAKVVAIDASTAFICGDSGFIARTSNAGASWETTQAGYGVFRGLDFIDANTGWAVGTDGEIWSTTNGGDSWTQSDISSLGLNASNVYLEEVLFSDASNGVVIGYYASTNIALVTDDGGASWTLERPGSGSQCDALAWDGMRFWMGGMYGSLLYRGPAVADTIDPVTTAVVTPATWTNGNVSVRLSAIDYQSGVASTLYALGSSPEQPYMGQFTIAAEGVTTISYRSIDASGNAETTDTVQARIDKTPPVTTASVAHGDGTAVVTLTPTDPLSDVDYTQWTLDGGSTQYSTTINIAGAGDHTVTYSSTDNAGNTEGTKPLVVTVTDDTEPPVPTPATISRVQGNDRYGTAVAVSKKNFATADTVVLATGADFADALAASGLAGAYDGSLLLTKPTSLPAAVKSEISRLKATQVFIVGGTSAVSPEVASQVDAMSGVSIKRIFGNDRYRTAAAIAREIEKKKGTAFADRAFIARGDNYADALAAAPVAYSQGFPILLTKTASLPSATSGIIKELGITDVVIAGGTGAVSADVANALDAIVGVDTPVRAQGADRYKTARAVADLALARKWADYTFVGIATGVQFPDGLAGGAAAGANGGVLLLTKPDTLTPITADAIKDNASDIEEIQVYGGTGAVADSVYKSIEALLP